jgi:hypothetical protein
MSRIGTNRWSFFVVAAGRKSLFARTPATPFPRSGRGADMAKSGQKSGAGDSGDFGEFQWTI